MAKTKQQKKEAVRLLVDNIKSSKSAVFANFQGLKVRESEELRGKCREAGVSYFASKKTIVKRALRDQGHDVDVKSFDGGVAAVFGHKDEVAPAQILADFAKDHEVVRIFGGILDGVYINADKVAELSKLPSRHQLLGRLAGTLNAPISGFANVLAGNIRGLVNVLNALKDSKA